MSRHDLSELTAQYPTVIRAMGKTFTSHEFILELAQRNQRAYIDALHAYRESDPFMTVHSRLAKALTDHPELVEYVTEVPSQDIFKQPNSAAQWRRR